MHEIYVFIFVHIACMRNKMPGSFATVVIISRECVECVRFSLSRKQLPLFGQIEILYLGVFVCVQISCYAWCSAKGVNIVQEVIHTSTSYHTKHTDIYSNKGRLWIHTHTIHSGTSPTLDHRKVAWTSSIIYALRMLRIGAPTWYVFVVPVCVYTLRCVAAFPACICYAF